MTLHIVQPPPPDSWHPTNRLKHLVEGWHHVRVDSVSQELHDKNTLGYHFHDLRFILFTAKLTILRSTSMAEGDKAAVIYTSAATAGLLFERNVISFTNALRSAKADQVAESAIRRAKMLSQFNFGYKWDDITDLSVNNDVLVNAFTKTTRAGRELVMLHFVPKESDFGTTSPYR